MTSCDSDLLIIGGGPGGLSAAINGASEGLSVRLIDSGSSLGGQARESSGIENYPGFPESVTGHDLMTRFVQQAHKFNTLLTCPVSAASISRDRERVVITTDDFQEYVGRAAILSIGLSYRRLMAKDIGRFMGHGVFYGAPSMNALLAKKPNVSIVVGGANSAGQAAVGLARNPKNSVKLVIRKAIDAQMSTYLIEKIAVLPNVEVMEGSEVVECFGDKNGLSSICISRADGSREHVETTAMYVFIGAIPRTLWLKGVIDLDDLKFVKTDVGQGRLAFETSMPGVFAAGDVRSGSTKRIASAIGEGACALQMIHRYLETRP